MRAKICLLALPLLAAVLLLPLAAHAATITIVNIDGPGEGFNDTTPVTPVGGNPGTTLGEQRLIAFQFAADVWGATLDSAVEIFVQASFDPLTCDAGSAVLGSAGAIQIVSDFAGAAFANTWYHIALANALAGTDLITGATGTNADDIRARFNSAIDNNEACLAGTSWYLGLDNNPPGSDIDLVVVLLHEFGHGLGFSNFIDDSTGSLAGPPFQPDIYSVFSLDKTTGLHWNEMSNQQRAASAINTGNVVWDGPAVTAAAGGILAGVPVMIINSPAAIAGTSDVQSATFGPALTSPGITGNVVLADDGTGTTTDACEPLVNAASVSGNIALVDRGTCTFVQKVLNAQNAGATAVLVANNDPNGLPPMGGSDPTVTVVSVGISQADGNAIKANLPGVNVSLDIDDTRLAGANMGFVQLYAPNPVEPGSSISHFDTAANPDLLMEPAINPGLGIDLDLTDEQMTDIGWSLLNPSVCGNGVREGTEECDGADLGGATCGQIGCNLGSPTCTGSCTLDFSGCSDCGPCNFNGVCELGEDCNNCASDCVSGPLSGATCGNGLCEAGDGEDCVSCPQDCNGVQSGRPANRFCCGGGGGTNPVSCNDARCSTGGFACTDIPQPGGTSCCGDLLCQGIEDSNNCALDCPVCNPTENPETSCLDGVDNDCDGLIDDADPDCHTGCVPTSDKEKGPRCSDGLDNDCDGLIDAADPDC